MLHIIDLHPDDAAAREQAAVILLNAFRADWPDAWEDLDEAREEVTEALEAGKVCRIARDDAGNVLGWIGGYHSYARVWELHPLAVDPAAQGQGVGRALIADFEAIVVAQNGLIVTLGSDDESGMTSLSGVDLYPDPWPHIARIQNLRRHPFAFYQKCGYTITGVIPDANGLGKPDILMTKRVGQ